MADKSDPYAHYPTPELRDLARRRDQNLPRRMSFKESLDTLLKVYDELLDFPEEEADRRMARCECDIEWMIRRQKEGIEKNKNSRRAT